MKATKLFLQAILFLVAVNSQAQVSVNVNIGTPPVWATAAPVAVEYYYLPDIGVYYDVPAERYIYLREGKWHRSHELPPYYRGYDLYHGNTVYLTDYRGHRPYEFYKVHKGKYKGNGWKSNGHYNDNHGKGHGHGKGKK